MMSEQIKNLDRLKEQVVALLNNEVDQQAAQAYQNCIDLIDDFISELSYATDLKNQSTD